MHNYGVSATVLHNYGARTAERSLNVRGSETSLNRLGETSCRVSRGPACGLIDSRLERFRLVIFNTAHPCGRELRTNEPDGHFFYGTSELFLCFLSIGLLLKIFTPETRNTDGPDGGIANDKRQQGRPDLRHAPTNRAPKSPKSTVGSCNGSAGPSARPHAPP